MPFRPARSSVDVSACVPVRASARVSVCVLLLVFLRAFSAVAGGPGQQLITLIPRVVSESHCAPPCPPDFNVALGPEGKSEIKKHSFLPAPLSKRGNIEIGGCGGLSGIAFIPLLGRVFFYVDPE